VVHQPDLDDRFPVAAVQPRFPPGQRGCYRDDQAEQRPALGWPAGNAAVPQRDKQEQQQHDEQEVTHRGQAMFLLLLPPGQELDRDRDLGPLKCRWMVALIAG
jgi:hypothetical protein